MKGKIFEIKRFAVHDGDGIRTTVFLKGCPLKCIWCHNPEGIDYKPQLAYYQNKCIGCGECISVCNFDAHKIANNNHVFERDKCKGCGSCADSCLGNALMFYGKDISVEELLSILLEDKEFFDNSDGGITLSGGECLMQADFCMELLKELKARNIHTAVDTCGFVPKSTLDKVMPYVDIFLYDMKAYDEDVHIKCTGQSNKIILANLKYIDECNKKSEVRIPYVPEYNSDQIQKIADYLKEIKNLTKVRVLPYHNYAASKYCSLDMVNNLPSVLPTDEEIKQAESILSSVLDVPCL